MSSPVPLRTSSLSRRVVLGSLAVLLVVLAAAGVLTDVLLGAQLRADAATRLNTRVADAQTALDSGAQPREVVAAAQGDGVTAALLTADGKVVGNVKVKPAPGGRVPPGPPARAPNVPVSGAHAQQLTQRLSDGSVLTVAVDTAGIDDVRAQLRTVLIPLLLGALVLAAVLLTVATRTALRPLDRMTALAQSISRGQRGRRLTPTRTDTELGRTAGAFDEMLDALEGAATAAVASESRTRRFVADAAHELRTPLAGVLAAAEAALGAGPRAERAGQERLQLLVVREARRASRLVEDLLSLASIDSGLELRAEYVDLGALVDAQVERTRLLAPGLTVEVLAHPCTIRADPNRLDQVLANLLDNARRHTPRPGRVQVRVRARLPGAELLVLDDGPGVPEQDRERIFDRLVRLDDARARDATPGSTAGSGLGLSIARGISRAHGGELRCVTPPHPWIGTAFLLQLPG